MTISSTTRKAGPFTGNDTATVFPFAFKVFAGSDLYVVKQNSSTGVETVLALTTDYTVSLNADQNASPGGNVTLPAALATGYKLTLASAVPQLQATDYTNQGGFYPSVLTSSLDRLTILIQQQEEQLDRTLAAPISDAAGNLTLPTAEERANKTLAFDADGNPVTAATPVDVQAAVDEALQYRDEAEVFAGEAEDSAAASATSAAASEVARLQSQTYAAAAATGAKFYDTIALGRAAVADTFTFGVKAGGTDGLTRASVYRRDSAGTQTLLYAVVPATEFDATKASTTRGDWCTDTFTEASTTLLTAHVSDSGHRWEFGAGNTTSPSVYTTASGVVASGATAAQIFRVSQIAPAADVKLTASLYFDAAPNYNKVGLVARLNAAGTAGYVAYFNKASTHWEIVRLGAAMATTLLASSAFSTYGSGATPSMEFRVANAGTTCVELTLLVNGLLVASASDTGGSIITAAGYSGVYFDTTSVAGGVFIGSFGMAGIQQAEKPRLSYRAPYIDLADYDVDPTFTVDSTVGIQQAILDAYSRKIQKIKGMPGRFKIAGALNGVTNSQLYIPYSAIGDTYRSIYIEGSGAPNFEQQGIVDVAAPVNGMIFESTIAGSGTNPAIIGVDDGSTGLTLTNFGVTNMGFRTRVSSGANSMSALNFTKLAQLTLLDMVRIDVDMGLQSCPTPNSASCGLIMPATSNHALLNVGMVYISGYYTGVVLAEHSKFDNLLVVGAVRGIRLDTTGHGSHIGLYLAEHVAYPIWIAGNHPLTITHYTTEHNTNIAWATYVRDIHNAAAATRKLAILRSSVCNGGTGYDDASFSSNDAAIYKILVGSGAN